MIQLKQIAAGIESPGKATLDQPLEHLFACHRRIEERLNVLIRAAAHLEDRRAEALEAIANSFRFLDSSGVQHTADEEESVFPRMRRSLSKQDVTFLEKLEDDHREVDRVYESAKDVYAALAAANGDIGEAAGRFQDIVERLCGLYRAHIAAEDERLIGLGRAVLSDEELSAIAREMKIRRNVPR